MRLTKGRDAFLLIDTGLVAATNALLLLIAARVLPIEQLSEFSLFQLVVSTAVGLQRALFLTPSLAAQRITGRTVVPLSWILFITVPLAVVTAVAMPFVVDVNGSFSTVAVISLITGGAALTQDVLRFCLFSRENVFGALTSDAVWLVCVCAGLLLIPTDGIWSSSALIWGAGGWLAVLVAAGWVVFKRVPHARASLRDTLKLGKWSGLDAALSGAANLAPMIVTSLVLGSDLAAIYRVLQTALGPLNILSASIGTSFGMDSWRLSTRGELRNLSRRVRVLLLRLAVFSVLYVVVAEIAIVIITGIESPDLLRVGLIVAIAGVLGSLTIPPSSASLALGYQRFGVAIRVLIVASAFAVTLAATSGLWVPWGDPIGTVTLISSTVGLAGWSLTYLRGMRSELRQLPE